MFFIYMRSLFIHQPHVVYHEADLEHTYYQELHMLHT